MDMCARHSIFSQSEEPARKRPKQSDGQEPNQITMQSRKEVSQGSKGNEDIDMELSPSHLVLINMAEFTC